jgi:hypothetical protein
VKGGDGYFNSNQISYNYGQYRGTKVLPRTVINGDVIGVLLDMDKYTIRFFFNADPTSEIPLPALEGNSD